VSQGEGGVKGVANGFGAGRSGGLGGHGECGL